MIRSQQRAQTRAMYENIASPLVPPPRPDPSTQNQSSSWKRSPQERLHLLPHDPIQPPALFQLLTCHRSRLNERSVDSPAWEFEAEDDFPGRARRAKRSELCQRKSERKTRKDVRRRGKGEEDSTSTGLTEQTRRGVDCQLRRRKGFVRILFRRWKGRGREFDCRGKRGWRASRPT